MAEPLCCILAEDLHIGNHDNVISYMKLWPKAIEVHRGKYGSVFLGLREKGGGPTNSRYLASTSAGDNLKEECSILGARTVVLAVFKYMG